MIGSIYGGPVCIGASFEAFNNNVWLQISSGDVTSDAITMGEIPVSDALCNDVSSPGYLA